MENAVITNEGRALITSVIANNGTLSFTVAKVSDTDYVGQEATLTLGTFTGTFMEKAVSASVQDATTIKVTTTIRDSGDNHITEAHEIKSVGIVATDGNTTALLLVCTTSNPTTIEPGNDPHEPSSLDVDVSLGVSSTQNITVVGSAAGVLYTSDVVDNLTSTAVNEPLSANMGRAIGDNLAANEESGAKNRNSYPYYETTKSVNGVTFTDNGDGTVTASGIANNTAYFECHNRLPFIPNTCILKAGTYILTGGLSSSVSINIDQRDSGGAYTPIGTDFGSGLTFTIISDNEFPSAARIGLILVVESGTDLSTPVTIRPMICDARVIDSTFAPYAKTNKQLTDDKAERTDISTISVTGTTNTSGAQIDAGTIFYLNGTLCKALANIAVNAAFTLNTNFKVDSVGEELSEKPTLTRHIFTTLSIDANGNLELSMLQDDEYPIAFIGMDKADTVTFIDGATGGTIYEKYAHFATLRSTTISGAVICVKGTFKDV